MPHPGDFSPKVPLRDADVHWGARSAHGIHCPLGRYPCTVAELRRPPAQWQVGADQERRPVSAIYRYNPTDEPRNLPQAALAKMPKFLEMLTFIALPHSSSDFAAQLRTARTKKLESKDKLNKEQRKLTNAKLPYEVTLKLLRLCSARAYAEFSAPVYVSAWTPLSLPPSAPIFASAAHAKRTSTVAQRRNAGRLGWFTA